MPTLYKDTNYSLTHLIEDIKHGNIALPDIQRPFVWSAAKVRDLFDSIFYGARISIPATFPPSAVPPSSNACVRHWTKFST